MEAIILVGLPASGKSTFVSSLPNHVRVNLDTLKTRSREDQLLASILREKKPFVVDNTNPTPEARKKYIDLAKANGYRVKCVYFDVDVKTCLARNAQRDRKVPPIAIYGIAKKMVKPSLDEGIDEIAVVKG